ncbi:MAG TPA: DinB family protein [Pyrinomonadaceae bacterium]|nr:DinB family protein [Pyrinomonadaceae bacterium]
MPYNSVSEIFEAIDETHKRLCASVENLNDEQASFRPAPGVWSTAEVVEHLSIIERQLVQLCGMMLTKTEAGGNARADDATANFAPVSIEQFVEQSRTQKYESPEVARPKGEVSLADSLARMREARVALHALRPRIERVDATAAKYPHPAFGPLDFYQWLAFIAAHEERHLRQIERLKESPGFATADGTADKISAPN